MCAHCVPSSLPNILPMASHVTISQGRKWRFRDLKSLTQVLQLLAMEWGSLNPLLCCLFEVRVRALEIGEDF